MQDQSKPEQKPKFFLPLKKESWREGWKDAGGVEQIMYFEQECIKKDVDVSVATWRDPRVKMKPHVKNGILLFCLFLARHSFSAMVWFYCSVLFCFFMIFGIFATCKIEGGANHVNVKPFYNYWKCIYLFIYVLIYLFCNVFYESIFIFLSRNAEERGIKSHFQDILTEQKFCFFNTLKFDGANILCH